MAIAVALDGTTYFIPEEGETDYVPGTTGLNAFFQALVTASNTRKADILLKLDKAGAVSAPALSSTTTLTSTSNRLQVLTPAGACNYILPSTATIGDQFFIANLSGSYSVTIKTSDTSTKKVLAQGTYHVVANSATPTGTAHWDVLGDNYVDNSTRIASNLSSIGSLNTSVAGLTLLSSGQYSAPTGTVTLAVADKVRQVFNPAADQIIKLPKTSVVQGNEWTVENLSYKVLDVQDADGHHIRYIHHSGIGRFVANTDAPDAAAKWNANVVHPVVQYTANESGVVYTNGTITLSLNTAGLATVRCVLVPYITDDEAWRLRGNVSITRTADANNFSLTISGIVSKNVASFYQNVSAIHGNAGSPYGYMRGAYFAPNTSAIAASNTNADDTTLTASFDIELNAKPTWAD